MKFILSSDKTFKELYEAEQYKYLRVEEAQDLVGFPRIEVRIHDCWMEDINDCRVNYLLEQLEILADFGYIKIVYIDSDGWEDKRTPVEAAVESPQRTLSPEQGVSTGVRENSSQRFTEEDIQALYDDYEDDCGGACTI